MENKNEKLELLRKAVSWWNSKPEKEMLEIEKKYNVTTFGLGDKLIPIYLSETENK